MSEPSDQTSRSKAPSSSRMRFLRDVAVFQAKLLLDNLRDLTLAVLSLVAAVLDLADKDDQEGRRFYAILRWGRKCQKMINLYSMLEGD